MIEPDYHNIFNDLIAQKDPDLKKECEMLLKKNKLSVLDIIALHKIIFRKGSKDRGSENQKYKTYDQAAVVEILQYGQKHKLNNTHLAEHFNLSRNTIAKWKKKISSNFTDVVSN